MNTKEIILLGAALGGSLISACNADAAQRRSKKQNCSKPNIILVTADDLGWMSLGCYGSKLDVTPNLDKFASEGIQFNNGYVNAAISSPSRKIMMTGLFGHNSGAMGFEPIDRNRNVPILADILAENGYRTGILGKVPHSSPYEGYEWDYAHDYAELGRGRNPELYAGYTREFIEKCQKEGKPFYFMINSHDPHRPYHDPEDPKALAGNAKAPSKIFSPDEIEVPGFLLDNKLTRLELSHYYNSTRRLDDTFGAVMEVFEDTGIMDNTMIVFLSDNGIAMPFAKANAYYASNRVPFMVRWPGNYKNGVINESDFVMEVDLLPTFLDIAGIDIPSGIDGRSFKAVLEGKKGQHSTYTFNQIDRKIGGPACPMRSIITEDFAYIYNAWPDGKRFYRNNNEGLTMKSMEEAAETDKFAAERVNVYRYRTKEEFYNMKTDKASVHNLINEKSLQDKIQKYRDLLEKEMIAHSDTLLPVWNARKNFAEKERLLKKAYPTIK